MVRGIMMIVALGVGGAGAQSLTVTCSRRLLEGECRAGPKKMPAMAKASTTPALANRRWRRGCRAVGSGAGGSGAIFAAFSTGATKR